MTSSLSAEVAVARFARVDEEGRRSGRRKSGRNLAADVARLADARHQHAAPAFLDQLDGGNEVLTERAADRRSQRGHAARFGIQCAQRRIDQRVSWVRFLACWRAGGNHSGAPEAAIHGWCIAD